MAAINVTAECEKAPVTCSVLLRRLEERQKELRKNLDRLNKGTEERHRLTVQSRRHLLERPLNTVKDFPRKRARLELLSPEIEPKGTRKHLRRLSSTPKKLETPPVIPSAAADLSLEQALLNPSQLHPSSKRSEGDDFTHFLPSPKLSRVVVDTSRSLHDSPVDKTQRDSFHKKALESKASGSRRGLSVSFVDDTLCEQDGKREVGCSRTMHSRDNHLGESLIQSLNASRHGALDRTVSRQRSSQQFPRKYNGDDPKLGYDWIAGLLDASDSYFSEKDDEYFKEMKEFRRVNCSDCSLPREAMLPDSLVEDVDVTRRRRSGDESQSENVNTTCVRSYCLNNRFFPIPQHMNSELHTEPGQGILETSCPVCEDKPVTNRSPTGYIRVSVPKRTLQRALGVRPTPHRRRSFDPTDSMGLSKHCLAGWETAQPSIIPPQPSVDLKGAVDNKAAVKNKNTSASLLNMSHSFEYNLRTRLAKGT